MSGLEKVIMLEAAAEHRQLPGPNKLMQAMEDYDHAVAEAAHLREELRVYIDIANKVSAENESLKNQLKMQAEFLTRQIDLIIAQRDRLLAVVKGLTTRFSVIRECFDMCEKEALAEGIAADVAGLPPNEEQARANLERGAGTPTWQETLYQTK